MRYVMLANCLVMGRLAGRTTTSATEQSVQSATDKENGKAYLVRDSAMVQKLLERQSRGQRKA
jgi:hypothetical protein